MTTTEKNAGHNEADLTCIVFLSSIARQQTVHTYMWPTPWVNRELLQWERRDKQHDEKGPLVKAEKGKFPPKDCVNEEHVCPSASRMLSLTQTLESYWSPLSQQPGENQRWE